MLRDKQKYVRRKLKSRLKRQSYLSNKGSGMVLQDYVQAESQLVPKFVELCVKFLESEGRLCFWCGLFVVDWNIFGHLWELVVKVMLVSGSTVAFITIILRLIVSELVVVAVRLNVVTFLIYHPISCWWTALFGAVYFNWFPAKFCW